MVRILGPDGDDAKMADAGDVPHIIGAAHACGGAYFRPASPTPYADLIETPQVLGLLAMASGLTAQGWLDIRNLESTEASAAYEKLWASTDATAAWARVEGEVARYLADHPSYDAEAVRIAVHAAVEEIALDLTGRHDVLAHLVWLADSLDKIDKEIIDA